MKNFVDFLRVFAENRDESVTKNRQNAVDFQCSFDLSVKLGQIEPMGSVSRNDQRQRRIFMWKNVVFQRSDQNQRKFHRKKKNFIDFTRNEHSETRSLHWLFQLEIR